MESPTVVQTAAALTGNSLQVMSAQYKMALRRARILRLMVQLVGLDTNLGWLCKTTWELAAGTFDEESFLFDLCFAEAMDSRAKCNEWQARALTIGWMCEQSWSRVLDDCKRMGVPGRKWKRKVWIVPNLLGRLQPPKRSRPVGALMLADWEDFTPWRCTRCRSRFGTPMPMHVCRKIYRFS